MFSQRSRWLWISLVLCGAVAAKAALAYAAFADVTNSIGVEFIPASFGKELLVENIPWFVASPLVAFLTLKFLPPKTRWFKVLGVHICFGLLLAGCISLITPRIRTWMGIKSVVLNDEFPSEMSERIFEDDLTLSDEESPDAGSISIQIKGPEPKLVWDLSGGLLSYLGFAALGFSLSLLFVATEQEQLALQMKSDIADLKVQSFRNQLQPHFLFNALNGIHVLVEDDPARAQDLILALSNLLRATLHDIDEPLVTLEREFEILAAYLEIERVRFGDRIEFSIIRDPHLSDCLVPSFCLQPLVENTLKHGPGTLADGGRVTVEAKRDGVFLILTVADDGPGISEEVRVGHGLSAIRGRLPQLYPLGDAQLSLNPINHDPDTSRSGCEARLKLPIARGGE